MNIQKLFRWKYIPVFFLFLAPLAQADNGSTAYAPPCQPLTIDGLLDDWPEAAARHAITRNFSASAEDFQAHFRAAYSIKSQSLYVAVEVTDDHHVVDEKTQQEWTSQDSHLLYVDPYHELAGSGPWVFAATGPHRKLFDHAHPWDPRMAKASWQNTEVQVSRRKNTTIYEWRIGLGEHLIPGNTIGLDHVITDMDPDDGQRAGTFALWGKFGGKSRRSARLGDLILLKPNEPLGVLEGEMRWAEGIDAPPLVNYRVRIQSVENPDFWVQPEADGKGHYCLQLPPGTYKLSSPFPLYGQPFRFRVSDDVGVTAAVDMYAVTQAPLLEFTIDPPPPLLETKGLLFNFDDQAPKRLDRFIHAYMTYYHIPGLSIALVKDGAVVYHKVFGFKNMVTKAPVDENTLFEAGSITKIVFAFAVNRLAQRGEIDLDKPLYQYLPFPEIAHDDRYRQITARHVLHHRTGFPNWARYNDDGKLDIKFRPGSQYRYSGEGFEYLGRVVAHITGKDLEKVLEDEVLQPANITKNIAFADHGNLGANLALGHDMVRPNTPYLPKEVGVAHSMHTEAKTLTKFMLMLMNKKGLSAEGYHAMYSPYSGSNTFDRTITGLDWEMRYGLGFKVINTPYGRAIGHSGSNHSNESLFEFYEDYHSGFIVLTNSDVGRQFYLALRKFLITGQTGLTE